MFKSKKPVILSFSAVIISVVLFLLAATDSGRNTAPHITAAADASSRYSQAVEKLSKESHIQLTANANEILKTEYNTFHNVTQQNIIYRNYNTINLQFYMDERISMGSYTVQSSATLSEGTLYHTLNGSKFTGSYNPATQFQSAPAILLDPTAYQTIAGIQVGDSTLILLADPICPETWSGVDTIHFQDACGSVWLNQDGDLIKSTYNICYMKGDVTVYKSLTVQITSLDPAPVTIPSDAAEYTTLPDPNLPKQLEIACGYLMQATNIESCHSDTVSCQIFGDTKTQEIDIFIAGNNSDPSLELATTVNITNSSRVGEVSSAEQIQRHNNGTYTVSTDGSSPVVSEEVSSQELLNRCREVLIGTILLPQHVQNAKTVDHSSTYRIEFTANEEFVQKIVSDACGTLYNEPQLLDELASEHRVDTVLCYLEFSRETGLPVASGIHFSGTYYVSELPYQLLFEADQIYMIQ